MIPTQVRDVKSHVRPKPFSVRSYGEITEFMSDPKGDLLVSSQYISGIEFANIFDLTGGQPAVTTRTLANVIKIYYNPVLDQQWAIQNILKPGHDCSTIMDFSTREKVPSDITALIGEIINMHLCIAKCVLY